MMTICVQVMSRLRALPSMAMLTLSLTLRLLEDKSRFQLTHGYFSSGDAQLRQVNFPWRTPVVSTHVISTCFSLLQWFSSQKPLRASIPGDQNHQKKKNHRPRCFLQMVIEPQSGPPSFNASLCAHTPLAAINMPKPPLTCLRWLTISTDGERISTDG